MNPNPNPNPNQVRALASCPRTDLLSRTSSGDQESALEWARSFRSPAAEAALKAALAAAGSAGAAHVAVVEARGPVSPGPFAYPFSR